MVCFKKWKIYSIYTQLKFKMVGYFLIGNIESVIRIAWWSICYEFLSSSQRDLQRRMNPLGRSAERSTRLVLHLELTPHQDQDLVAGVATLYTLHPALWAPLETMEVQVPTKTSNSHCSTRLMLLLVSLSKVFFTEIATRSVKPYRFAKDQTHYYL